MKEVRAFIVADLVVLLVKVLGGILTHSYTMIASGVYDVALILISLVTAPIQQSFRYSIVAICSPLKIILYPVTTPRSLTSYSLNKNPAIIMTPPIK